MLLFVWSKATGRGNKRPKWQASAELRCQPVDLPCHSPPSNAVVIKGQKNMQLSVAFQKRAPVVEFLLHVECGRKCRALKVGPPSCQLITESAKGSWHNSTFFVRDPACFLYEPMKSNSSETIWQFIRCLQHRPLAENMAIPYPAGDQKRATCAIDPKQNNLVSARHSFIISQYIQKIDSSSPTGRCISCAQSP